MDAFSTRLVAVLLAVICVVSLGGAVVLVVSGKDESPLVLGLVTLAGNTAGVLGGLLVPVRQNPLGH